MNVVLFSLVVFFSLQIYSIKSVQIPLIATGNDPLGVSLAVGEEDHNWYITETDLSPGQTGYDQITPGTFVGMIASWRTQPELGWVDENSPLVTSQMQTPHWITPVSSGQRTDNDFESNTHYTYTQRFFLPVNTDLASVIIMIRCAADNEGDVYVNGQDTFIDCAASSQFPSDAAFITGASYFVAGANNNLEITVVNSQGSGIGRNPTGVLATVTGIFECLPGFVGLTCDSTSGSGDPHLRGFRGQHFDFMGIVDSYFNLVSDEHSFNMNMKIGNADLKPKKEKTYMTDIGFVLQGNVKLRISCNRIGSELNERLITVNDVILEKGNRAHLLDGGYIRRTKAENDRVVVENNMYRFSVRFSRSNHSSCHLNFRAFAKYDYVDNANVHGVLGQTVRPILDSGKKEIMRAKGDQGEGIIEGTYTDYIVDDLFATDFKYSMYDTKLASEVKTVASHKKFDNNGYGE